MSSVSLRAAAREVVSLPLPAQSEEHPGALGLVLVDRALDLLTPSSHPDHLMDLLLAVLPRQPPAGAPLLPSSSSSASSSARQDGARRGPAAVEWR